MSLSGLTNLQASLALHAKMPHYGHFVHIRKREKEFTFVGATKQRYPIANELPKKTHRSL